jgi:Lamin Tail Domain
MPSVSASPTADFVNIVINEIMTNPSTSTQASVQWIELYNGGSGPVNLKGWYLSDNMNQWRISTSLMIDTGDYSVLGNISTWYTDCVLTGLSLTSTGDVLSLHDAKRKLRDRVEWNTSWPTLTMGASMALRSPTLDNALSTHWCTSPTKFPDGHQNKSMGTPGSGNNCPEPFGTIRFSEYMRRPGLGRSVWIELYNDADYPVNLKGWRWTTSYISANSGPIPTDLYIPAKGYFVYGRYNGTNATADVVPNYFQSNLQMTPSLSDQLIVRDPNNNFHDYVNVDAGWSIVHGASMALKSPSLNRNVESNWCVSRNVHPSGVNGTPGAANDCL